jgi:hypothetical protein
MQHLRKKCKLATVGTRLSCDKCEMYVTMDKPNYKRHIKTCTGKQCIIPLTCAKCNRVFQTTSGQWKHEKKCQVPDMQTIIETVARVTVQEQKTAIVQNPIIHINNGQINNHLTLQVFLNERCKDAMNIMDFARNIQLTMSDLQHIGRVGYATGMGDVITNALQGLALEERPLHCTDVKRETLHVKHENEWRKEEPGHPILMQAIHVIGRRNWTLTTGWNKLLEEGQSSMYDKMRLELTGGPGASDVKVYTSRNRKIIKRVCSDVSLRRTEIKLRC